jgi:hypothetical protein
VIGQRLIALVAGLLVGVASPATRAASPIPEPVVDLGETSFLDGEAGPGGLLEFISNGYHASYVTDQKGHALPGPNGQAAASITLHPAYVSDIPALGGNLGLEFLFPFAAVRVDAAGLPQHTQGGVGDITVAPFIQWSDLTLADRPFALRFGLQGVVPTGSYEPGRLINIGQNVWQISPYWAATWHASNEWEISGRLIYDWSSANTAPSPALGASSAQPGDQLALNLSASYALDPDWRIGVAGYALRQLDPTRLDNIAVPDSEQQAFALGPSALWTNGRATMIGNVYREFATENRPEGFSAVLRLLWPI